MVGAAIALEVLEATWTPFEGTGALWHGTWERHLDSIAREGLKPGQRSHVHLAPAADSHVGKRHGEVLLEISSTQVREAGEQLWTSGNGVVLARWIPPRCILKVHATTKKSRARIEAIGAAFEAARTGAGVARA